MALSATEKCCVFVFFFLIFFATRRQKNSDKISQSQACHLRTVLDRIDVNPTSAVRSLTVNDCAALLVDAEDVGAAEFN